MSAASHGCASRRRATRARATTGSAEPSSASRKAGSSSIASVPAADAEPQRADNGSVAHEDASYPGVMSRLRVAAAQIDVVVGDLEGNIARILDAYEQAEDDGCDLVVFPELTITGYPPEDLLLRPAFVAAAGEALEKVAARTGRCAAAIGYPQAGRD